MKKILLFISIPLFGISQTNHELEFNSATLDYVEILNTSAVIANTTAFSISGWVNPQSNTNHGGIMGFRNNIDADFYLLQLQNTNNIEARFRNSLGVNYDIITLNALDFNQWQHLAFTYDGSYIRLYKDGIFLDSTAANGTITQTTQSFKLGTLDWQGSGFYMIGRLDEIRLWDVAVSQTEINNWMCFEVDTSHPNYSNLMGYWNLNEGIGMTTDDQTLNGNNGTILGGTGWQISSSCLGGVVLCGDVNEDGVVDQTDVTDINNFISGGLVPVFNLWAADVNCDGGINILDITTLNSFISGTVTTLNCCSSSPLTASFIIDSVTCCGYCDGQVEVLVSLGTPPYSYSINGGSYQSSNIFLNLCAGIYICDIIDANGNTTTISPTVFEPICLTSTITSTSPQPPMSNGTATVSVIGGTPPYTYQWSDGQTTQTSINLSAGTYSCTIIDANGCVEIVNVTLSNDPTNINEVIIERKKILIITDVLGRKIKEIKNTILFYIFDDGTVEKKIIIE